MLTKRRRHLFGIRSRLLAIGSAIIVGITAAVAQAQHVQLEEFTLANGMKFLLVPRSDQPNAIAAGWVAKVGSVNERPGITGISHFFEHMMFKGTHTIGTRDPARSDELMARQTAVHAQILEEVWTTQYRRLRQGEIDDPWNPENDTPRLKELRAELKQLIDEESKIIVKNEFDSIYTRHGGSGMNAFTANDLTFYFINVPSNKFELWAWMESDRLRDSVFREFYAERDVVHEERRLRTESTPTGIFDEQFDAMFWQSSPYHWPVIGWTSDLNSYTMEQAKAYFDTYYRPGNLVGIVVGDFDAKAVKGTIEEYFGRLEKGAAPPPPVVTLEMPQQAEQRFYAVCDCQPQIEIRYHTVPWGHADSYALDMITSILNGRSGRLNKAMVEGDRPLRPGIASSASTATSGLGTPAKYAGFFAFTAETKGDTRPEDLEAAWEQEVERLKNEPVGEAELQKVKNQRAANAYRSQQSNFFLMLQLGLYEAFGDWRYINDSPAKFQAVTAADIQRVAKRYFEWNNRSIAIFERKPGTDSASVDPEFAAVDPAMQGQVRETLKRLLSQDDPAMLRQVVTGMTTMKQQMAGNPQAAPGADKAMEYMIRKLNERIAELEKAASPE
jgi:predicted Zn-dependent peptidase